MEDFQRAIREESEKVNIILIGILYVLWEETGAGRTWKLLNTELHVFVPVFVDDVADDERGEEEQAVAGHSALRLDVDLMDGDHLPLWCGRLPHYLEMM